MRRSIVLEFLLPLFAVIGADLPAGKEHTASVGIKLVRVEAGAFVMGSGDAPPKTREEWDSHEWDEAPAHKVKITKPFFLGSTEVTNAQYEWKGSGIVPPHGSISVRTG